MKYSEKFFKRMNDNKYNTLNDCDEIIIHIFNMHKDKISENLDACWSYSKPHIGEVFHKSFR